MTPTHVRILMLHRIIGNKIRIFERRLLQLATIIETTFLIVVQISSSSIFQRFSQESPVTPALHASGSVGGR